MKNHNAFLLAAGLVWQGVALEAQVQTNDAQKQALEVLRKTIESLDQKKATPPKSTPPPAREPDFEEVQRLYLEGKLSAKEFQTYLDEHKVDPGKVPDADATSRAVDVLHKEIQRSETSQAKPPGPAPQPGTPTVKPEGAPTTKPSVAAAITAPEPDQSKISEVEKKMDELLALKAARERAAASNVSAQAGTNSTTPPAPQTKRDRLNDLLRQVVAGKISDAEYKEKRSKIVSEPD